MRDASSRVGRPSTAPLACLLLLLNPATAGADKPGPDLGPLPARQTQEPAVTRIGSDLSSLPSRYPSGEWIPLLGSLLSMQLVVEVQVAGQKAKAVVDTGASATVMSRPVAQRLGILGTGARTRRTQVMDAHGSKLEGTKVQVKGLTLGARHFPELEVIVFGKHPSLFLLGADLLEQVDLFIAADQALLGIFPRGKAPIPRGARAISLSQRRRQLRVEASAPSTGGKPVVVELIVDTGASQTAVPTQIGVNGHLPADIRFRQTTVALGGEQEHRGRFLLDPLRLGPEKVLLARVLANPSVMERGRGVGLLGNDVMARQHTVISFGRSKMWLARATKGMAYRSRGPGRTRCLGAGKRPTRCINARIVARAPGLGGVDAVLPDRCLEVRVHPRFGGRTLELALSAYDEHDVDLLAGGALRVYLTVGQQGFSGCFGLRTHLARVGLQTSTRLALRWVRAERIHWACSALDTECLSVSGPYADGN